MTVDDAAATGAFDSAGAYFSAQRSDEWKCVRCATVLPSPHDGESPVSCHRELGGCGRSRDGDEDYTYFVPTSWTEAKVQLAIDSFTKPGQRLFNEVVWNLQRHFYFKEAWQYRILGLYVLQCAVAKRLPGVFYVGLGGAKGSGKTTLQAHVARLARGHIYSNVSIAAFARTMKHGDNVCVDEIDETRGGEYDSIRGALLRDGYKSNGPKYDRWDYKRGMGESFSVYGPKIFGYRGGLEDALRSRTFPIAAVKPAGLEGAKYVNANLWPEDDGLPARLEEWGRLALDEFTEDRLKETANTEEFRTRLGRAVREIGANRETELSTIALLVAHMADIDIVDDLRAANEAMASVGDPEPLEQLQAAVRALLRDALAKGKKDIDGAVRLRQVDVRTEVNNFRIVNRQKPLTDHEFARWRRDLGIDDNMLTHPGNKTVWRIPPGLVASLLESEDDPVSQVSQSEGEANHGF